MHFEAVQSKSAITSVSVELRVSNAVIKWQQSCLPTTVRDNYSLIQLATTVLDWLYSR